MTSTELAYKTIRNMLESGTWTQGRKLPPLAKLASICNVSPATVWKAVDRLRKESLLDTRRGGAIIAGPPGTAPILRGASPKGLLWERLKSRIGREVLAENFKGNELPPVSKLSIQYGTTRATIGKALDALARDGLLQRHGVRYRPAPRQRHSFQRSIVLIAQAGTITFDPRSRETAACFERECARLGISSRLEGVHIRNPGSLLALRDTIGTINNLSGCIFTLWNQWDQTLQQRTFDLLWFLISQSIPIVIIDQSGNTGFPPEILRSKFARVLRISNSKAGHAAADLLFRLGHRRIAFIAPEYESYWVRERHASISEYFSQYGTDQSRVELFTLAALNDSTQRMLAVLGIDKESIAILFAEQYSAEEIVDLQKNFDQALERNLMDAINDDAAVRTIRFMARSMVDLAKREHEPEVYRMELERLQNIAFNKAIELYQRPFLLQILKKSSELTAWVFAEEKSALAAVDFLRSHGIKVPEEIAVFGFDNWRENMERQLSTYDFNMSGIVQQAVLMILDETTRNSTPVISEVEGYIVERKST